MELRRLGRTGLQVSVVGFGGSPIAGIFRSVTPEEATTTVRTALDVGINYFDTAPYYGFTRAEAILGRALQGVPREKYLLATKVGRYDHGFDGFDFSAARVVRSVDESLQRLGGSHLDVIQVHDLEFGSLEQVYGETLPALDRLRASGKVRFVGITGLPLAALRRVQGQAPGIVDTVLSYCHGMLNDDTVVSLARELGPSGVGMLNAAPLGMGLLTQGGPPAWHPAPPPLRQACAAAAAFCATRGADLADVALRYALGLPGIDCHVLGLASADEVHRAVACVGSAPDPTLLAGVRAILAPVQGMTWLSGHPANN